MAKKNNYWSGKNPLQAIAEQDEILNSTFGVSDTGRNNLKGFGQTGSSRSRRSGLQSNGGGGRS